MIYVSLFCRHEREALKVVNLLRMLILKDNGILIVIRAL
jgi:hypothetical protein